MLDELAKKPIAAEIYQLLCSHGVSTRNAKDILAIVDGFIEAHVKTLIEKPLDSELSETSREHLIEISSNTVSNTCFARL